MSQIIIGNWKMHGTQESGTSLAAAVALSLSKNPTSATTVLCPPATLLAKLSNEHSSLAWGAQDCHIQTKGAYTGDLSVEMLKDAGAGYIIVGHSERRQNHNESDALVAQKAAAVIASELIPVICVGENQDQREGGQAFATVEAQLKNSLPEIRDQPFLIAYEPVWAIGSGKVATLEDIEAMHAHIKSVAAKKMSIGPASVHVLYGGSVKAQNARDILLCPLVDGVLVGGASLDPHEFSSIIEAARP